MLCKESTLELYDKYMEFFGITFPSADIDTDLPEDEFCRILQRAIDTGIPIKPEEICMEPLPPGYFS